MSDSKAKLHAAAERKMHYMNLGRCNMDHFRDKTEATIRSETEGVNYEMPGRSDLDRLCMEHIGHMNT